MSFVEWAGKKEYKCPRCKGEIKYAKFTGSDGKLLTTDGKEPFSGKDESGKYKSNTGFPTNILTKQMHECSPKEVGESQLKQTELLQQGLKVKELNLNDVYLNKILKNMREVDSQKILAAKTVAKEMLGENAIGAELGNFTNLLISLLIERERRENVQLS